MRKTRIQKINDAIMAGASLTFDYMPKNKGRAAIEGRVIAPLQVNQSQTGRLTVLGESAERDGALREFRVDRMFHVNTTA